MLLVILSGVASIFALGQHIDSARDTPAGTQAYLAIGLSLMLGGSGLLVFRHRYPVPITGILTMLTLAFPTTALPALIALASAATVLRGWRRLLMIGVVYLATVVALLWDLASPLSLLNIAYNDAPEAARLAAAAQLRWYVPLIAAVLVAPFAATGFFRSIQAERDFAKRSKEAAPNVATLRGEVSRERHGSPSAQTTNWLADLRSFLDAASEDGTVVRALVSVDDPGTADPAVSHTCYRIVQEVLSHARQHTPGTPVRIDVRGGPETGLTISATTWMPPGIPARRPGHGLRGMSERAALLGGTFQAGPTTDGAFAVASWLPWQAAGTASV